MRIFLSFAGIACAWLLLLPGSAAAQSGAAEIVLLIGKGERREAENRDWAPAALKQQLPGGAFVRTLANSQMGLLLADRTQLRLNQNSQLQIKSEAEAKTFTETTVRLNAGRAWSQARPQTGAQSDAAKRTPVTMETPSVTMSIRGTDWEVEVAPDGSTQLVVLSGTVAMENARGALLVGPGEAATAEIGKAPVKLILINPASRVQWVSSWRPNPGRWAGADAGRFAPAIERIGRGDYAAALEELRPRAAGDALAAVLAADLLLSQGEVAQAVAMLSPHARDGAGDPRAVALLAHALARDDKAAEAAALVARGLARNADHELLLAAQGEIALLQGDAALARDAYGRILARQPGSAEAWYGLGLIESEREHVRAARRLLGEALARDARLSKATAELAAAETFAGNLDESERLLQALLDREPDNYVALTAQGLARLKRGAPTEALESFMKAGLVEPRYARAWLYSGVAFYQLGERERALEAFRKAAALDPRDPIPYFYESIVRADALQFGASIDAAREAQKRMPFLRSLNQIANDQKGSANLGSALANFGQEEWAGFYANEAYSPFWAGSNLFLADRQTGLFNKNSELFKGFITDPTVFGASNRRSTLVSAPGNYARVDLFHERTDFRQSALIGTLNGLTVTPVPLAYFLSGDLSAGNSRDDPTSAHGRNLTIGLGARPRYDLGVFGFATDTRLNAGLRSTSLPNDAFEQSERRADLGFNFKPAPDNQFWFKAGDGMQRNGVQGSFISQSTADTLNRLFGVGIFVANGTLDRFRSGIDQDDQQFRHSFRSGNSLWTWGVEQSKQDRTGQLVTTFLPVRLSIDQSFSVRATDAYASLRQQLSGNLSVQADLYSQNMRVRRRDFSALDIVAPVPPPSLVTENSSTERRSSEWNPRIGVKWQATPAEALRAVAQRWRRPASVGTLASIDTLGVALDDRLPVAGGLYKRARLQYDAEIGAGSFFQAFVDSEHVDNGLGGRRTAITDFELTQLASLRNRPEVFAPKPDLEDTPIFGEGRVRTLGLAANHRLAPAQTVSVRYLMRDSRQGGANTGLKVPFVPKDYLLLGSQWELPQRWLLGASAAWRGQRFRDDTNLDPIRAGWSFGFTAYWESADKRSSVQGILDNLLSNAHAGVNPDKHLVLRYAYRF